MSDELTTGSDVTDQQIIDAMQREIDALESQLDAVSAKHLINAEKLFAIRVILNREKSDE